jgi:hypothetical protein
VIFKPKKPNKVLSQRFRRSWLLSLFHFERMGGKTGGTFLKIFISSLEKVKNNVIKNFKSFSVESIGKKREIKSTWMS